MTPEEYTAFCRDRADGRPSRRRPESIRPHDPLLAMRVAKEQEAEKATDDQARSSLRRTG